MLQAKLEFISKGGETCYLPSTFTIGSAEDCDYREDSPDIGPHHCCFEVNGQTVSVRDLNSGHPTLVNGQAISAAILKHGDEIRIGSLKSRLAVDSVPALSLFISYGRTEEGSQIANRLKADLEKQGHTVWLDVPQIRTGESWQHEIMDGIRSSQIVIALMSPHSVRTRRSNVGAERVDSVCLGEIAYALYSSESRPIIPIKVAECEPPLAIYHLDYIEMTRWRESESQYRDGLSRLLKYLDDAAHNRPRYRKWHDHLQPWDFGAYLDQKRAHFTGRGWLFQKIDRWREDPNGAKALLITGQPGIGKSAIVAQLVHDNVDSQVLAYHCCKYDTKETLEPARFVRSIAGMIASRLPEYAAQLDVPAIRDILSEGSCLKEPNSAFERGVLAPLQTVHAPPDGVRYILVDALDEALTLTDGGTIVDLLNGRFQLLPKWLRIVATSRSDPSLARLGIEPYEVKADDPLNLQDLRLHISARLESKEMQNQVQSVAAFAPEGGSLEEILRQKIDLILARSDGNWLYVQFILDELEKQQPSLSLLRLEAELPVGLTGWYRRAFERQFGTKAERYSGVRRCLEVITAAREPLEGVEIAAAVTNVSFENLWRDSLAHFFPRRTSKTPSGAEVVKYSAFHKSMTDWLTSHGSGDFRIVPAEGDRILAKWSWREFEFQTTRDVHRYWVRHGAVHVLRTIAHLYDRTLPRLDSDPFERHELLYRSVELIFWLKGAPETKTLASRSIQHLSMILMLTKQDLSSASLAAMEKVDQLKLYDLAKDCGSTAASDRVIWWIGRTQLDPKKWATIRTNILELGEWVMRYAAAGGQAARYIRLKTDPGLAETERQRAKAEVIELLSDHTDMDRLEMGSYAVGRIARERIPDEVDEELFELLEQVSKIRLHFCQTAVGDLLTCLSLHDNPSRDAIRTLTEEAVIKEFWDPVWEINRLDVIAVLAQLSLNGGASIPARFDAEVADEVAAMQRRAKMTKAFVATCDPPWNTAFTSILTKAEIEDVDCDRIFAWLTREGVEDHVRLKSATELMTIIFSHPWWRVLEEGAAILDRLGSVPAWRNLCFQLIDRLLMNLDRANSVDDRLAWRLIFGTAETCFILRHAELEHDRRDDGQPQVPRFEKCVTEFFGYPNCQLRGLLVEDLTLAVDERDPTSGKSSWASGRAAELLERFKLQIERWMIDEDVWVLEHVHCLFQLLGESLRDKATVFSRKRLIDWRKGRLQVLIDDKDCLLANVSADPEKPWYEFERADFLIRLQELQQDRVKNRQGGEDSTSG